MHRIHCLHARLATRLRRIAQDRGDSPVPSAIIIAGLAIIAVALVAWIYTIVDGMMENEIELPGR